MYHIIGKERVDYVSEKTHRHVLGYRFYYFEEDKRVEGYKSGNFFVSDEVYKDYFSNLCVDDFAKVFYNQYGYIVAAEIIKSN